MSPETITRTDVLIKTARYFVCDSKHVLNFSTNVSKKYPISNFTEILPLGAALIRENKMTDMGKVIGTFCDYANAPKNDIRSTSQVIKC